MPLDHHRREFPLFSSFHRGLVKDLAPAFANGDVRYAPAKVNLDDDDHRAMTGVRVLGATLCKGLGRTNWDESNCLG